MSTEPGPGVDPTFYRMIGELTGEVRGLKESVELRTRHTETQVGEIKSELQITKHEAGNQRIKMAALETLFGREVTEIRDRVTTVERRIDGLDTRVARGELPLQELTALRGRALAWLCGASAAISLVWLVVGPHVVAAFGWLFHTMPETKP